MKIIGFDYYGITDIGNIKKVNQDKIWAAVNTDNHEKVGAFIVADGMGGYEDGEKASEIAVENIKEWWDCIIPLLFDEEKDDKSVLIKVSLEKVIEKINQEIMDYGDYYNMKVGTTLSILVLYDDRYIIKHIGDSRIYRIDKKVKQLTEDHSWVSEQVRLGRLTEKEAKVHPHRNVLTECLGMKKAIKVWECMGALKEGDRFLICSDGLYKKLSDGEMKDTLRSSSTIEEKTRSLVDLMKKRGERDNLSCVIVKVEEEGANESRGFFKGMIDLLKEGRRK